LKPHDEGHGAKKMTRVERFHTAFNAAYDSILKKYKKHVVFFIHKKWLSFGLVAASIILLVFFMKVTPTGMVPNEDTGTIMGAVTLPPGTSQERAMEILNRVDSLVAAEPAVDSRTVISGFGFIGGQGPSYGSIIIKLKDWEERSMMQNSDIVVGTLFMRAQKIIKDAQVLFFAPPMIPGYSASSDIELNMQDKTGGDLNHRRSKEQYLRILDDLLRTHKQRTYHNIRILHHGAFFPIFQLNNDRTVRRSLTTYKAETGNHRTGIYSRFGSHQAVYTV
jgi:HAE1 family hydrophobic/amphiphilic exporter-1